MTTYTAAEVLDALSETDLYEDGWSEIAWVLDKTRKNYTQRTITIQGADVPVEVVATDDGGEYGFETFVILRVGSQMFRKTGYYRSHYGNDWDGPFVEVVEAEKTITVYEAAPERASAYSGGETNFTVAQVTELTEGFDWGWYGESSHRTTVTLEGVEYTILEVEREEADGSEYSQISTTFSLGSQFFRKHGSAHSHDGGVWNGQLVEVFPTEKTIVVYE